MPGRHVLRITSQRDKDLLALWCKRAPLGWEVEFRKTKRSSDQNRKLWAMLQDLSEQVEWHGHNLTREEWKDVMTAGLKKQRAVPGIDGGFVVLGDSTSKMTKQEFSDLVEVIYKFGAEMGVVWTDPAEKNGDQ